MSWREARGEAREPVHGARPAQVETGTVSGRDVDRFFAGIEGPADAIDKLDLVLTRVLTS